MTHRRRRSSNIYKRREAVREPYETVLIVCEGEKTEPNYFRGLVHAFNLSSANVGIVSPPVTDPMSLVDYAVNRLGDWDRVFCVFDRDNHARFGEAIQRIVASQAGRDGRWRAIVSHPCFEFWVLLHFTYTSASFTAVGNSSACDQVMREVKKHFAGYEKSLVDIFAKIHNLTDEAIKNALQLEKHNRETNSDNPATYVHHLVEYLRNVKK